MIGFPSEICEEICADYGYDLPCYLAIGKQSLKSIFEKAKNTVLEWCIQLEKEGINGEEFTFNEHEKEIAKEVNNYYGQVINGNAKNSISQNGNNNLQNNKLDEIIREIEDSLKKELDNENLAEAMEVLEDIDDSIKKHKKTSIIKNALTGLKDFLISTGANVTAALITQTVKNM